MLKYMIATALLFTSLLSFSADFVAGKDYELTNTAPGSAPGSNTVIEFFSFGCPWCYRLEPSLEAWVKRQGTNINFQKVPVIFNKDWEYYAKAFYTIKALSLSSQLNPLLFKAIIDDKQPLNTKESMIAFLTKNGIDATMAQSAFNNSPSIDIDIDTSQRMMANYHIAAVPAFVVHHRYKTDLQMAKTEKRLFEILDFLLTLKNEKKG